MLSESKLDKSTIKTSMQVTEIFYNHIKAGNPLMTNRRIETILKVNTVIVFCTFFNFFNAGRIRNKGKFRNQYGFNKETGKNSLSHFHLAL